VSSVSLALYRTYRPGRLSEVVGQEHVTEPLGRALDNDRVHHAYLFSGPRGCGKTSTARILARSLNCEQGPTSDPCGECTSCIELAPNGPGSLDVIELDAASHGGVDDTRDLRERAMFAPVSSRYKVYIIDEAHMVTSAGFNALLKLVEEPPEHVRFIFATTEVDKVLPTIRSRTHNYTFRLVPTRTLQAHLASVCEAEGVTADPAALALVARMGAGSVRDSLSILGQLLAGADGDVTYASAVAQLGVTDTALVDATITALADVDGAALFTTVDSVVDAGYDPRRYATDLLQRLRDLIVLTAMPVEDAVPLLEAPEVEIDTMRAQAARFDMARLSRAADLVSAALSDLRGATAPRLHLELLAARLLLPSAPVGAAPAGAASTPPAAPKAPAPPKPADPPKPAAAQPARSSTTHDVPPPPPRLSSVAPTTAASSSSTPPATPEAQTPESQAPDPQPAPPDAPATTSATVTLSDIRTMWPAVLEAVKSHGRVLWMRFSDASAVSFDNGVLAVGIPDAGRWKNIKGTPAEKELGDIISSVLGASIGVDAVLVDGSTSGSASGSPENASSSGTATPAREADAPSLDDEDAEGSELVGESLAIAELGATVIGEITEG
jgi:DNA polymerase III subunit gamma/tau